MSFHFIPAAERDLLAAVQWYLNDGGPVPAELFETAVVRAARLLARMPGMGTPWRSGARTWPLRTFPYTLVYRPQGDGIQILAVAHQSRDQGYWAGRV